MDTTEFFGNERISKILFKLAPPVMLAQLIQALYNIVDSLFVGRYSDSGLTALSIIYPIQLLMIALAVGTGVGINTVMAARLGVGNKKEADEYAGTGTPLALALLQIPPAKKLFPHHVSNIFRLGMPNILMQTCIVPVISFNYAAKNIDRCKKVLKSAILFGLSLISIGTICFLCIPGQMLLVFTSDKTVIEIGKIGFHFVGISFLPMVTSLIFPVFFQAIGASLKSSLLTIIRTVILFVPLGFLFSRFGLTWFWLTFPVTEILTSLAGAF